MYFKNWLHKRKGNDSDGDSGVEVYEYKERDTNLDINAAFNGARQSQSPRSSKFDMSEVGYRRSQALAYRGTEESSAPLSYPAMADDLKDKPDLEAARRRSAFSTESVVKEATAPFPMVPSTYRPGSMYRGSENRTSTIQEPETVPLSTSAVQPDKHNDMPVRAVEPVYGSLMAPRDLPALRRSLSKAASPANKHSTSTSDMHALAESVSEKKNESKSVGSVGTHWSRTALGGSQFTDNEALERGTVRPLTSSLMLEDMENGGVARQLQIQSRNPSPLLPRAEEGTTITRRASSHIDMPSAAEEDEGAPKQTDSAASERGPVTVFSLPETAQFSPIRL